MVTPNPAPSQADYNAIMPILALAANTKGSNTADLSAMFNELMGVMSNSYTAPSQMSDAEIEALYGPTIASTRTSNDPTLQGILTDIENGVPIMKVKEAVRKAVYNTKTIQLQPGQDISMYDNFIDTLFKEKNTIDQKKFDLANKETIYEKYGLPDIKDQYDPTQMPEFQDMYSKLLTQRDTSAKERDARLKAIEDKFMASKPKAGTSIASFDDILKGLSYGEFASKNVHGGPAWRKNLSPSELQAAKTKAERINAYLSGQAVNDPKKDPKTGEWVSDFWTDSDLQSAISDLENTVGTKVNFPADKSPAKITSRERSIEEANKNYLKELAGATAPQRVASGTGGAVTKIPTVNLRDPVARQERLMALVTEKIQQKMGERGQTPLGAALISRILLNKQMGK